MWLSEYNIHNHNTLKIYNIKYWVKFPQLLSQHCIFKRIEHTNTSPSHICMNDTAVDICVTLPSR